MGIAKPKMAESLRRIHDILLHEWDPIGVREVPEAKDEYNSYIFPVYRILRETPSLKTVAEYLYFIETDRMGLLGTGIQNRLNKVALQLLALQVNEDEPLQ